MTDNRHNSSPRNTKVLLFCNIPIIYFRLLTSVAEKSLVPFANDGFMNFVLRVFIKLSDKNTEFIRLSF